MSLKRPEIRPVGKGSLVVHMIKNLNQAPPVQPADIEIRTMDCRVKDVPLQRDIEAWLSIQNASFRSQSRPWTRVDFKRELWNRSWFQPGQLWLAESPETGTPVGTITLEMDHALRGRIHWLAVHGQWRRRGIGRRLVQRLERECWQRGGRRVALETLGTWKSVIRFYQALGYQQNHGKLADHG